MGVDIQKLDTSPIIDKKALVKVTEMGNVTEIQYMSRRNNKQTIQMLPGGEEYLELSTGEVKKCIKHNDRSDLIKNLKRTFKTARGLINSNITDVNKARWITLTYAENMTDTVKLYKDFEKFNKRFHTYCKNNDISKPEYIVMMEPQRRGAWHAHLLYIFNHKAPYIPNETLRNIWGHGFVTIKKLDNVDNVGAYLTAYLGDMEITELSLDEILGQEIKEVEIVENGKKIKKSYIKGARLKYYPPKFNMIRCSRGVKRPTSEFMTLENAEKKVSTGILTFEKSVKLVDTDNDFESIINTKYYNSARKNNQ